MNKTTNKQIVQPAQPVSAVEFKALSAKINYNTFLMLTPVFKSLITSTNNAGKYNLKVTDYKKGFYFYYKELNLKIAVPLTAVFNTNNKTAGILGIAFSTAINCPSRARGLCQLEDPEDCYAYSGERQNNKKYNAHGLKGMSSYHNGLLSKYYFALFNKSAEMRAVFKAYCNYYKINTLRFNLKGDFKSVDDIKNIEYMAEMGFNLTGYTARDDLRPYLLDLINNHDNIILNGSNMMYNNQFNAVDDFKTYLTAEHQCLGGCIVNGCLNCYRLKNVIITVLLHGASAGVKLNTGANRIYLSNIFNLIGLNITPEDLKSGADLYRRLNIIFRHNNYFKAVPDHLKKINKSGLLVFESHGAVTLFIRHILRTTNTPAGAVSNTTFKGGI